jgi:hypothetical protein
MEYWIAPRGRARRVDVVRIHWGYGKIINDWVDSVPDAQAFERYLETHPGAVQLWLGGHTHTHPDDTYGGKSHSERKWGTYFLNVCWRA